MRQNLNQQQSVLLTLRRPPDEHIKPQFHQPARKILRPLHSGLAVLLKRDAVRHGFPISLNYQALVVDPRNMKVVARIDSDEQARAVYSVRLPKNVVVTPGGEAINLKTRRRIDRLSGTDIGPVLSDETVQDYVASKFRPETPKEERFTRFSSVLTRKADIVVKFSPGLQFPSAWHPRDKVITIHENYFETPEEDLQFILNKAALFHEDSHVLFTRHSAERDRLAKTTTSPQFFYTLSNFLEDGRIERLLPQAFPGTEPYLRAKAAEFGRAKNLKVHPLNDLKFRVYCGRYLTKEGNALFGPHDSLIQQAISAKSSRTVWEISAKLTDLLAPSMPTPEPSRCAPVKRNLDQAPPEPGQPVPSPGQKEGEGPSAPDGEEEGEEGEGEDGEEGGQPGDGGKESPIQGGAGAGGPEVPFDPSKSPDEIVSDIQNGVRGQVAADVKRELETLTAEDLKRTHARQELLDGEDIEARLLSDILRRWRVEAKMEKWKTVHSAGQFDPRRLVQVATGDACLRSRIARGKFDFDSVLIGDDSGSMGHVVKDEFSVLRVLTAALRGAGFQTKPALLNAGFLDTVPLEPASLGSTPIGEALEQARAFLAPDRARRKVVFLVTDGVPNSQNYAIEQAREAREDGISIIGIFMGDPENSIIEQLCDRVIQVKTGEGLKEVLPQVLMEFAAEEVR